MVPGAKLPQRQNVPGAKCPKENTSYSNYQVSKTNFVLENWSHMLGNAWASSVHSIYDWGIPFGEVRL